MRKIDNENESEQWSALIESSLFVICAVRMYVPANRSIRMERTLKSRSISTLLFAHLILNRYEE